MIYIKKLGIILGIVALFFAVKPALADSYSTNFEGPTFSIGNINGQDGWIKLGSYDAAIANNVYGIPTFGTQSFRISNSITSGSFGDQTFAKSLSQPAGESDALNLLGVMGTWQRHFETQFDIATTSTTVQNGLALSISPDRGDGARMSYLKFVDQSDGIHVFFDDVVGQNIGFQQADFRETEIPTITRTPHTIKFSMDFIDGQGNDVVKIYIDGVLVHTGTSWENYYRYDTESNPTLTNNSRTVSTVLFREGGTAVPANSGNGFLIDNFSESSGPILIGPPTNKDQCKNNGWKTFNYPWFQNQGACVSFVNTGLLKFDASNSMYYNGPTNSAPLYGTGAFGLTWDWNTGIVKSGYYNEVAPPVTGTTFYNIVTSGTVSKSGIVSLTFDRTIPNVYHFIFTGNLVKNLLTGFLDGPYWFTATGN